MGNSKSGREYSQLMRMTSMYLNRWTAMMALSVVLTLAISCTGCTKPDDPDDTRLKISGVSIPSTVDILVGGSITITGTGFNVNDQIHLTLVSDNSISFVATITSVTDNSFTFLLPSGVSSGSYRLVVVRGLESLALGSLTINVIADNNIPDITGMTIKGLVYCNGVGIPGVAVSDGYEVTVTDSKGVYYLPSLKKSGYVFISVPGNYEVAVSNKIPQFFKRLSGGTSVEQKDFSLIQTNNTKHVILASADWHLANRNDDLSQFGSGFLPDINATIQELQSGGAKVYGMALGDVTWDLYWYENSFGLQEYLPQMNLINCPTFNVMGNHDNDPYSLGDWLAEKKFKDIVGPSYYSFNLGSVHYIVLDNIEYLNTGGAQGVIGARNYNDVIVADQMAWLQKDLATITDKSTPIIFGSHHQLYTNPGLDLNGNETSSITLNNGSQFLSLLQEFTNVHILNGHTHINYAVKPSQSVMTHSIAAVCATWWWTGKNGYAGNNISTDGSPGGYSVWEVDGRNIKWYYKSVGSPKSYQFRAYDLNTVHITAAAFAPNSTDAALLPYAGVYANQNLNNEILINVWGYDQDWTIEVKEGTTPLPLQRVQAMDPLHIISYEAKRLNYGAVPTSSFVTGNTAHMFKATATSPNSTINISVTDRFGRVYTETMLRPKPFTYLMR